MYKILADENIPHVKTFFGEFGEIRLIGGRQIDAQSIGDANVLLLRSVTKVNEALLKNSRVKFIGSATIGSDHIDLNYLRQAGIAFANAPGCNANSVAEYVLSAILALSDRYHFRPGEKTLGIIGYGNVGKRVKVMMDAIGIQCLINDPLLQARPDYKGIQWSSFDEILNADIISLHVPLSHDGPHPTYHMFDQATLQRLPDTSLLINTSRGAVIDHQALKQSLIERPRPCVLDVWENEPGIDTELLNMIDIATPHIAGYSVEGKLNGVIAIYKAFCKFSGVRSCLATFTETVKQVARQDLTPIDYWSELKHFVFSAYNILDDDRMLKETIQSVDETAAGFDLLRKRYQSRREFSAYSITTQDKILQTVLQRMGFKS